METTEQILSRQYTELRFRDGQVTYFSISTQHDKAKTVEEAINNILEADKKYEGKAPMSYALMKYAAKIEDYEYSDPIDMIFQDIKKCELYNKLFDNVLMSGDINGRN